MPALKPNKQNVYQQGSRCQPSTQTNKTCIGKGEDACQTNIPLYIFTRAGHSFFCWDLWCTHFAWNSNTARRMRSPIGSNELPCIARTLFQPCIQTTFCWQDQMSQTKHQYDVSKCCNLIGRNINRQTQKQPGRSQIKSREIWFSAVFNTIGQSAVIGQCDIIGQCVVIGQCVK